MTTPAPAPAPGAAPVADGKTLGIVGLVLAFLIPIAGIIVSIIAKNQSKAAGVGASSTRASTVIVDQRTGGPSNRSEDRMRTR